MATNLAICTIAAVPYPMEHLAKPHLVIRKSMKIIKEML